MCYGGYFQMDKNIVIILVLDIKQQVFVTEYCFQDLC